MKHISELLEKLTKATGQPGEIVTGVLCIVVGLVVCFFGRRLLRPTLAVGGFAVGVLGGKHAVEIAQHTLEPESLAIPLDHELIKAVPFVLGIILGVLFMNLVSVGMYLVAAAGGMVLFTTVKDVLNVAFGTRIHPYVKIGVLAVSGLLPLILVQCLENVVVSVSTAVVGAAVLMIGVDLFAHKGFLNSLKHFWHLKDSVSVEGVTEENVTEKVKEIVEAVKEKAKGDIAGIAGNKEVLFMFGGFLAVAAAGAMYQLNLRGQKRDE